MDFFTVKQKIKNGDYDDGCFNEHLLEADIVQSIKDEVHINHLQSEWIMNNTPFRGVYYYWVEDIQDSAYKMREFLNLGD